MSIVHLSKVILYICICLNHLHFTSFIMTFWENKLIEDLNTIIKINVIKLGKIIYTLNEESQKQWTDSLKEEINESCTLLIEEATFFVAVQYLRKNCLKLCELLQIDMLSYETEQLTFYEEKKILEERLKEYEDIILDRQNRFKEMIAKQIKLCRLLEKIPLTFTEKSVPTEKELDDLSLHIQNLEDEKMDIEKKFNEIKLKIMSILQELNLKISPKIEKIKNSEVLNKENLQYLTNYYNKLHQKQNQKEYKELESLKKVINDLYNSCHILENERTITQNIQQYKLDVIQEEINKLKNYWENNRNIFILLEKYNQHWSKLVIIMANEEISIDRKHEEVMKLCRLIRQFESELIEGAMTFEENKKEPFFTYGRTIPAVIAELHDMHGTRMLSINNTRKTLSAIINDFKKKQQYLTANKLITNQYLSIKDSYLQNKRKIRTRQPLKLSPSCKNFENVNKAKSIQIKEEMKDKTDLQISSEIQKPCVEYQSEHKSGLFSDNSSNKQQKNINVNISSEENSVNVNAVMTSTISNKNLQSIKLKPYSVCKKRNISSYASIQTTTRKPSYKGIFKPKIVEMIQNLFRELELK